MDAEKEKRFRFQMQLEREQAQARASNPGASDPRNQPLPDEWESVGRGALQGATMGFGDEIYGAIKGAGAELTGEGSFADTYARERDEVRANNARAREANPWSYGLGEVGGGAATALIPGAGVAGQAAKLGLTGVKGAAAAAGVMGAVNAAGTSEADNLRDLGKDAATGAVLGAGGGALGYGVGKVIDSVKPLLNRGANRMIAKHVMAPQDFGRAAMKGQVQDMGEAIFENKIAGPMSGRADIAKNANRVLNEGVSAEQAMLRQTPDVDVNVLRNKVQRDIVDPAVAGGRGHSVESVNKLLGSIDDMGGAPGMTQVGRANPRRMMSGEALNELKGNWQQAFRKDVDGPSGQALKKAAREARLFEEAHIDKHLPGRLPEFMEAKGKVMIGGKVKAGMEAYANSPHNDLVKGGAAAVAGGLALGPKGALLAVGGAVGKHLMDGRETTAFAHAMKALGQKDISKFRSAVGKALTRNPFFLGKAGAKLARALQEDSSSVGKNTFAKVAWEESSNPELQQLLKEEREK